MKLVSVGAITGAHGVRGEVKLRSFTAAPADVARYGALHTASGRVLEIVKLRPQTDGFIAALKGVGDRDQAEALKGTELFLPRERLPEAAYLADLIGLPVWQGEVKLGEIVSVQNYGAGDLIEVRMASGSVLIPLAFVANTAEKITVDLPEGFLDVEER